MDQLTHGARNGKKITSSSSTILLITLFLMISSFSSLPSVTANFGTEIYEGKPCTKEIDCESSKTEMGCRPEENAPTQRRCTCSPFKADATSSYTVPKYNPEVKKCVVLIGHGCIKSGLNPCQPKSYCQPSGSGKVSGVCVEGDAPPGDSGATTAGRPTKATSLIASILLPLVIAKACIQ